MAKFFGFLALAATAFSAATAATVEDTCVIVDFTTATSDFTALNNLVTIIKASPALLKSYISDPIVLADQTLTEVDFSLLGMDFTLTPTIDSLNVSGITTVSPKKINVTSHNTIDLGTDFTGTVAVAATLSVEIAQLNHKWYQVCWTDIWHPTTCAPATLTVDVALSLAQPEIVTNITANMYECAKGISTSVCSNLTVTSILVSALSGSLTTVGTSILKHFKDAELNSLSLGWASITNIDFVFHNSGTFITQLINSLLDFSVDELNKKGDIYTVFIDTLDKLLLSLLNNLIDSDLEPLFGATCL
ncbi:hypothetical protein BBJ28_00014837 [Nothophytophthora sp. Chile5]|nr:hypothetical protein BBJ28_00014837 [Nothophytophthora sp. Chile5]